MYTTNAYTNPSTPSVFDTMAAACENYLACMRSLAEEGTAVHASRAWYHASEAAFAAGLDNCPEGLAGDPVGYWSTLPGLLALEGCDAESTCRTLIEDANRAACEMLDDFGCGYNVTTDMRQMLTHVKHLWQACQWREGKFLPCVIPTTEDAPDPFKN